MKDNTNPIASFSPLAFTKPVYPHAHLPLLTDMDVPSTMLMQVLHRALRVKRDHGTMTEARFVAWLCNRLPVTMIDGAGNIHVDLRTKPQHRTMFTSHTDTVHHNGGDNKIRLDASNPDRILWRADEGQCLGADDGAGVALMVHMIDQGVPGLYVFFRGEECGGLGSSWMDKQFNNCLKDIDRCVSFDRADTGDVITHQGYGRCCSDEFAQALADQLTTEDLSLAYFPDSTGVFTDSANLVDHIPECTNLSVGYKHQHGDGEYQDVSFLTLLADQLCLVQWDKLPTVRDPKVVEKYDWGSAFPQAALPKSYASKSGYKLDAFDEMVIDALYAAEEGYYKELRAIVAEHLLPNDPEQAARHLDMTRVSAVTYRSYADGIFDGEYDTQTVLDILMEDLQVQ